MIEFTLVSVALLIGSGARAASGDHPCQKVVDACTEKGFVKGEFKAGKGLWKDCVDPIMQGTPQPKNAKIPLPTVDASVIAACKSTHGDFGTGRHMPSSLPYATPGAPPPPAR